MGKPVPRRRGSTEFFLVTTCSLLISSIALIGCSSAPVYSPTPAATSSLSVPTHSPAPTPVAGPALTVKIDYFAVKSTHQPAIYFAPNTIQVYAVIDDGKSEPWAFSYPSSNEGIPMKDFQLVDLGGQTIFNTSSVGDYLKISVLAYSCEDKEATLSLGRALQAFEPSIGPLLDYYEKQPESKELIGWYEHTWYPEENWGMTLGKYEAVGEGDLRLWFRIWSTNEPGATQEPRFSPEVRIQSVTLPSNVRVSSGLFVTLYYTTLRLVNNESVDIVVNWQANSSVTGNFDNGTVTVEKYNYVDVTKGYYYTAPGPVKITYTIYYNGTQLDTNSGTLNVVP